MELGPGARLLRDDSHGEGQAAHRPSHHPGPDFFWLDTEAIGHAVLRHMLQTYSLGREVSWEDLTSDHVILSLIGPGADAVAEPLPRRRRALDDRHRPGPVGPHRPRARPAGGREQGRRVADRLGVETVSEEVAECVRIESGRPRLGYDMTPRPCPRRRPSTSASEPPRADGGQETVARLHYRASPIATCAGSSSRSPAGGAPRSAWGARGGASRIDHGLPSLGPIALAIVRQEAEPGSTVSVDGALAELVGLPFARG